MDRLKKIASFFAIYVIWGSTYLAIRYGIESIPPFMLSTARFFLAGIIMGALSLIFKEASLDRHELRIAALSGVLLILANAVVCVVEESLPSGLVAVVIGTMPIWMLLISWLMFQGGRPSLLKIVGSGVACIGIAMIASDSGLKVENASSLGFVYLAFSCLFWSFGTLVQKKVAQIKSPLRFSALQMLTGSLVTLAASFTLEKPWEMEWGQVTPASLWALAYLIVFGSLIAFSAYSWLSRNVQPYLVSTYALVNPVIAVLLGAVFYHEPITPVFLGATLIILIGLFLLLVKKPILASRKRPVHSK